LGDKSQEYEEHWLLGIALIFLIAIAPLPYEYYMLLRVISVPIFGYLFYHAVNKTPVEFLGIKFSWVFVGFGLLYNPFIPVHLTKDIWMVFNLVTAVAIVTYWYAYNNLSSEEFSSSDISTMDSIVPEPLEISANESINHDSEKDIANISNSSSDRESEFIEFMINFVKDYHDKNTDEILQLLRKQKLSYFDETDSVSVFPKKDMPFQVIFGTDKFKEKPSITIFCAEDYVGITIHAMGKEASSWVGSLEPTPMSGMGTSARKLFSKLIVDYGLRDINKL